jgi:hypothetical protein
MSTMRFIHLFLVGYFVIILAIALGLWQAGVFSRVPPIWIGIGSLVAIGVGIMLAVSSGKPTAIEPEVRGLRRTGGVFALLTVAAPATVATEKERCTTCGRT